MEIKNIYSCVSSGKHFINADIGASSKNGSLKIAAINDNGNITAKKRLTVFDEGEVRSEDKFEQNVAEKIAQFERDYQTNIVKYNNDDEVELTVCYPGPAIKTEKNKTGFLVSNFYYDDNKQQRFHRAINPDTIDSLLKQRGINVIQSRHANDMAGAGACLLTKIKQTYPEILQKEGSEILYLYPGGGLGTGIIEIDKDNIKVKPSEIQHIKKHGTINDSLESDAGAAKLRQSFAEGLGLTEQEKAVLGENTKAVTSFAETRKLFPYITKDEYEDASKQTILKFMDSVAQVIAAKVCESKLDTVILTGPVANGIREAVNQNSKFKDYTKYFPNTEPDNFSATLRQKVVESLSPVGQKLLGNPENLNVIFLQIADNTDGAQILQKGLAVGQPPAWYNIYN